MSPDELLDTEDDEDLDDGTRSSFFAERELADEQFVARFGFGVFEPTSFIEHRVCTTIDRIYTRKLRERGLIQPKAPTEKQVAFRARLRGGDDNDPKETNMANGERRLHVIQTFQRLEKELGHPPSAAEVAADIGDGITAGNVDAHLYNARKQGLLPRREKGAKNAKPASSPKPRAPRKARVVAKATTVAIPSRNLVASSEDDLLELRVAMTALDEARARVTSICARIGARAS